ncbi:MAG: phosphatidate cytidylyltransferase [Rhodobacteraceae bacterium]|nr:phosphatidate cytidylyltransferase [Paracoccaceae bacterium]
MSPTPKWQDLRVRVISAVVMGLMGAIEVWLGGYWLLMLVALICGAMIWELALMLAPQRPWGHYALLAVLAGLCLIVAQVVLLPISPIAAWAIIPLPALVGGGLVLRRHRVVFVLYGGAIVLACFSFQTLRELRGLEWMIWLLLVVIATDVMGYFAGRALGGPKFWPRVSPNKTWAGIIGGWAAAAAVGMLVSTTTGGTNLAWVTLLSVFVAFAAQMGDMAESALKRRCGVKDSSRLIRGHGGVLDRFDGLVAASLAVFVIGSTVGLG